MKFVQFRIYAAISFGEPGVSIFKKKYKAMLSGIAALVF